MHCLYFHTGISPRQRRKHDKLVHVWKDRVRREKQRPTGCEKVHPPPTFPPLPYPPSGFYHFIPFAPSPPFAPCPHLLRFKELLDHVSLRAILSRYHAFNNDGGTLVKMNGNIIHFEYACVIAMYADLPAARKLLLTGSACNTCFVPHTEMGDITATAPMRTWANMEAKRCDHPPMCVLLSLSFSALPLLSFSVLLSLFFSVLLSLSFSVLPFPFFLRTGFTFFLRLAFTSFLRTAFTFYHRTAFTFFLRTAFSFSLRDAPNSILLLTPLSPYAEKS